VNEQQLLDFAARGAAAQAAANEAIARVEANAELKFLTAALDAVRRCADELNCFTTDDVWDRLDVEAHEPRALGAVMRTAQRERIATPTDGYEKSRRSECHARPIRVWRSLLR
jgi:hypothetical protein